MLKILTPKRLRDLLKEAFTKGLNVGDGIGYQRGKAESCRRGVILAGINIDQQVEEILREKEF